MNIAEQKLFLFQKILSIENESIIKRLFLIIEKITTKNQLKEINLEDIDIETLSFEEWNELFMEKRNLNDYIPEYDMSLKDYRMKIYNTERGESYPINQFFKKLESYV